jgi:Resolvase, N terminal domain
VIVRDIDRLTRNLTDWNAFEKGLRTARCAAVRLYGADLDLSTAEGAYYDGMETLRARRESAAYRARVREARDREARKGRHPNGGQRWFGYTRIYANPDQPHPKKRHILREDIKPRGSGRDPRRGHTVARARRIGRSSSALAFRMASRSLSVMAGWRVEVRRSALVPSFVPSSVFALYVQTCARGAGRDGLRDEHSG